MPSNPSPLASLRAALAASVETPQSIASEFARKANSNASHNTYITQFTTEAIARAEQLPLLFPNPSTRPPLYGVPICIKDCFDITGTITTCGSRYYAQIHPPATSNSWIAQRLLNAGAILTGKTHLHQLAYGITGENADYGDCLQPRDATLLTGGSSSGAVASVQEGSALAAIGTDTGGSVRVPAALGGLAGYRASLAIGNEQCWAGGTHLAPSFDTLGVLFRDLRDAPALANAIFNLPSVPTPASIRIGYAGTAFTHDCEPAVLEAYEAWKQQLAAHGATLSPLDTTFWSDSLDIFAPIQASEAAAIHRGNFQHFEATIAQRLAWGASFTEDQIASRRKRHTIFCDQMSTLFQSFDFLIVPCAPVTRLLAGHDQSAIRNASLRYTVPISLAGLPTVTLPGEHIGAPFGTGVQLIAPPMHDALLLTFASTLTLDPQ